MDDAIASNWAQQLADPAMPALGGRGEDSNRDSDDEAGEESKLAAADSPAVGVVMH